MIKHCFLTLLLLTVFVVGGPECSFAAVLEIGKVYSTTLPNGKPVLNPAGYDYDYQPSRTYRDETKIVKYQMYQIGSPVQEGGIADIDFLNAAGQWVDHPSSFQDYEGNLSIGHDIKLTKSAQYRIRVIADNRFYQPGVYFFDHEDGVVKDCVKENFPFEHDPLRTKNTAFLVDFGGELPQLARNTDQRMNVQNYVETSPGSNVYEEKRGGNPDEYDPWGYLDFIHPGIYLETQGFCSNPPNYNHNRRIKIRVSYWRESRIGNKLEVNPSYPFFYEGDLLKMGGLPHECKEVIHNGKPVTVAEFDVTNILPAGADKAKRYDVQIKDASGEYQFPANPPDAFNVALEIRGGRFYVMVAPGWSKPTVGGKIGGCGFSLKNTNMYGINKDHYDWKDEVSIRLVEGGMFPGVLPGLKLIAPNRHQ